MIERWNEGIRERMEGGECKGMRKKKRENRSKEERNTRREKCGKQ